MLSIKVKAKLFVTGAWITASLGLISVTSSCARKPKDKIAYGENEFLYERSTILGSSSQFLRAEEPQDFTRKPFERLEGAWVNYKDLTPAQEQLIAGVSSQIETELRKNGSSKVKFVADRNFLYLGVEGNEKHFFSYLWKINGYYTLRDSKTVKGEKTGYTEKGEDGNWFERPQILISSNSVALPIKLDDQRKQLVFERQSIDGATYLFDPQSPPKGLSSTAWQNVVSVYQKEMTVGSSLLAKVVNECYRLYWIRENSQGRRISVEIARVPARLGFIDYQRGPENAPESPLLTVVRGEADPLDYDAVELSESSNPQIFASSALAAKDDYASAKVLDDLPNSEIVAKIKATLSVDGSEAIDVTLDEQYVFIRVKGTTFRWAIAEHQSYVGQSAPSCQVCDVATPGTRSREPLFVVNSAKLEIIDAKPASRRKAFENAIQKSDLIGKTFVHYPTVVDSTSEDPFAGSGQIAYGGGSVKVKFQFEKDFLSVVIVDDKRDITNTERSILKFPIQEHFNIVFNPESKNYERVQRSDWENAQYADVDFSSNLLTNLLDSVSDLELYSQLGAYTGRNVELLPETLNAKAEVDNPYLYLDKTPNKPMFLSYLTRFTLTPSLQFTGSLARPVVLKVRNGFLEVKENSQYRPTYFDRFDYGTFGIFTSQRYIDNTGFLDENEQNIQTMANIFHVEPAIGKLVTYHLNKDFPAEYCTEAVAAVETWNRTFQKAFRDQRTYVQLAEASAEEAAQPEMQRFKGRCLREDGTSMIPALKEVGDLRANMIVHFAKNIGNGLAGFGPSLSHPDTGEVLSASSFMYEGAVRGAEMSARKLYERFTLGQAEYEKRAVAWAGVRDAQGDVIMPGDPNTTVPVAVTGSGGAPGRVDLFEQARASVRRDLTRDPTLARFDRVHERALLEQSRLDVRNSGLGADDYLRHFAERLEIEITSRRSVRAAAAKLDLYATILADVLNMPNSVESQRSRLIQSVQQRMGRAYAKFEKGNLTETAQQEQSCGYAFQLNDSTARAFFDVLMAKNPNLSRDQFAKQYAKAYYFDVLVHEMGHNFGLYHNFKASADQRNYPEAYHVLSRKAQAATTDAEKQLLLAKARILRTSSVMDYNPMYMGLLYQTLETGDEPEQSLAASGLGPYDIAAITYAYKGQLEVAGVNVSDPNPSADQLYTQRIDRSVFKAAVQTALASERGRFGTVAQARKSLNVRPYDYCTNGDESEDALCATFDSGASPQDIVREAIERYEIDYSLGAVNSGSRFFAAYSSGLGSTNPGGRGVASRIRAVFDTYASYKSYGYGRTDTIDDEGRFTLADYQEASQIGFDFLANNVFGALNAEAQLRITDLATNEDQIALVKVPLEKSKNMFATYQFERYSTDARPLKRGVFFEMLDALEILLNRQSIQRIDITDIDPGTNGFNFASDSTFAQPTFKALTHVLNEEIPVEIALKNTGDQQGLPVFELDASAAAPTHRLTKRIPDFLSQIGIVYSAALVNGYPDRRTFSALTQYRDSCDQTQQVSLGPNSIDIRIPSELSCVYSFDLSKNSLWLTSSGDGLLNKLFAYSRFYYARKPFVENPGIRDVVEQLNQTSLGPDAKAAVEKTLLALVNADSQDNSLQQVGDILTSATSWTAAISSLGGERLAQNPASSLADVALNKLETRVQEHLLRVIQGLPQNQIQTVLGGRAGIVQLVNAPEWNRDIPMVFRYQLLATAVNQLETLQNQDIELYNKLQSIEIGESSEGATSLEFSLKEALLATEAILKLSVVSASLGDDYFDQDTFDIFADLAKTAFGKADTIRSYDRQFNGTR
jgi:hypothetical protein